MTSVSLNLGSLETFERLERRSFALVIADPPWNINSFAANSETGVFEADGLLHRLARKVVPLLKPGGALLVNVPEVIKRGAQLTFCPKQCETALSLAGFHLVRVDFWLKVNDGSLHVGRRWSSGHCDAELAHSITEWFMRFAPGQSSWTAGSIYAHPVERDPVHPAVWPFALACDIVEQHTKPGDAVLDLFMGRATVGRACRTLGRHYVGFEHDEAYFTRAVEYVSAAEARPSTPNE